MLQIAGDGLEIVFFLVLWMAVIYVLSSAFSRWVHGPFEEEEDPQPGADGGDKRSG